MDRGPPDLFGTSNGDPNDDRITRIVLNHGLKRGHPENEDLIEIGADQQIYAHAANTNSPTRCRAEPTYPQVYAHAANAGSQTRYRAESIDQYSPLGDTLSRTPKHYRRDPNSYTFATTRSDGGVFDLEIVPSDGNTSPPLPPPTSTPTYRKTRQEEGRLPGTPGKNFEILDEGSDPIAHDQDPRNRVVRSATPGDENDTPPDAQVNVESDRGAVFDEQEENDQDEEDQNVELARATWDHRGTDITPTRPAAVRTAFGPVRSVDGSPSPENRPNEQIQNADSSGGGIPHMRSILRGGAEDGSWSSSTRLRLRGGAGERRGWLTSDMDEEIERDEHPRPAPLTADEDRRINPHLWDDSSILGTNTSQATPVGSPVAQAASVTFDHNLSVDEDHLINSSFWPSTDVNNQAISFTSDLSLSASDGHSPNYLPLGDKERLARELSQFIEDEEIRFRAIRIRNNQVQESRPQDNWWNGSWRPSGEESEQLIQWADRSSLSNTPRRESPIPIQPPHNPQGPRPLSARYGYAPHGRWIRRFGPSWAPTGSGQSRDGWVHGPPPYTQHDPGFGNRVPPRQDANSGEGPSDSNPATQPPAYDDDRLNLLEASGEAIVRGSPIRVSLASPNAQHESNTNHPYWHVQRQPRASGTAEGSEQTNMPSNSPGPVIPVTENHEPDGFHNLTLLGNEGPREDLIENQTHADLSEAHRSSISDVFDGRISSSGINQPISPAIAPVLAFQPPYTSQQPPSPEIAPAPQQVETLSHTSTRPRLTLALTISSTEYRPETWTERTLAEQIGQSLERYLAEGAQTAFSYPDIRPALPWYHISQVMDHMRVYLAGRYSIHAGPPGVFVSVSRPRPAFLHNTGTYSRIVMSTTQTVTELQSTHRGGQVYDLSFTVPGGSRNAVLEGRPIAAGPGRERPGVSELWVVMDRGLPAAPLWQWVSIGFWDIKTDDTVMR
ncbi:uncharacterized protein RSE6_13659 [Rhynchosporium secalis]|uniref:Uncharacterized protein n=1 Tax=Rhynchosporium secalis TaxID=38038 RepID=A0A1E1MTE2_RHYSE|nr:uncharacterized protein RSE6_13659 [Rhynchosporium secalis]